MRPRARTVAVPQLSGRALLPGAGAGLSLSGRAIIVTGGGSGIGLACVWALPAEGAVVATCAHDGERWRAMATCHCGVRPCPLVAMPADVTDAIAMEAPVATTVQRFGGLDGVAAIAGQGFHGRAPVAHLCPRRRSVWRWNLRHYRRRWSHRHPPAAQATPRRHSEHLASTLAPKRSGHACGSPLMGLTVAVQKGDATRNPPAAVSGEWRPSCARATAPGATLPWRRIRPDD